ncbi:MAG: radical SAM family heme chaperone HemW [Pseudomonadota bacterium]
MPASQQKSNPALAGTEGFALYVHWPFCLSKCPYCDFNSHVREGIAFGRWERALSHALGQAANQTPGRRLTSIFFGGGTPSLMPPASVARLIGEAKVLWETDPGLEVTLEANPTSAEGARFRQYREAGVNRLSLGIQALRAEALRFLGRTHGVGEAVAALEAAKAVFPRVSFDLIYGLPGQTVAAWREELAEALALADGHLSLYQLTIEPGTHFFQLYREGKLAPLADDAAAALYETTQAAMEEAGFPAYEISNHARRGEACRHNLTYWKAGEYVGIGPGAHGRIGGREAMEARLATAAIRQPERWLAAAEDGGAAWETVEPLDSESRLAELAMMGLRLREGLAHERFRRQTGRDIAAAFPAERLTALQDGGFLVLDGEGLRATPKGRLRLNAVLGRLLTG